MLIGLARVPIENQSHSLQHDAGQRDAGCEMKSTVKLLTSSAKSSFADNVV